MDKKKSYISHPKPMSEEERLQKLDRIDRMQHTIAIMNRKNLNVNINLYEKSDHIEKENRK